MKSEEALAAEQSLEAKLTEIGTGRQARETVAATETAPVEGTPVTERPRDEQGRFAAETVADTVEQTPAPAQTAPEPAQVEDPAISAYLQKYGGDVNKALQAAVSAQRKLGEQSTEIGESRRVIEELSAIREQLAQNAPQPTIDQPTVDWFDQQVMENPARALEWAANQKNTLLLERGVSIWKDTDPYGAAMYAANLQRQQDRAEFERRFNEIQQAPVNDRVATSLNNILASHGEYVQYADGIENTIQKYPAAGDAFRSAVESGDQTKIEGALETLFALSERDTLRALALTGQTPADTTSITQVATQTETPEAHGEETPEPTPQDDFRAAFAQEAARYKGDRVVPNAYVAR